MNKINFDFEKQKIDYKWNVAIIIYFFFYYLYFMPIPMEADKCVVFDFDIEHKSSRAKKRNLEHVNISHYNRNNIISSTERKANEDKDTIDKAIDSNDKLNEKINKLKSDKDSLIKNKKILEKKINELICERDSTIKDKEILENKISELTRKCDTLSINKKNILENKNINIDSMIKEKKDLEKKIDDLTKEKETYKKDCEELIKSRGKYSIYPIKPGEEIMSINFVSMGRQDIVNFSLFCKNTDLFIREEERLYEIYPQFKMKRLILK